MKKKVLFIIQSIWVGGTNSALCSLYNNLDKSRYDISVWALDSFGGRKVDYREAMLTDQGFVAAYYSSGHYDNKRQKIGCFIVKSLKKIIKIFYKEFDEYVAKKAIGKIEKKYQFDTVVAYNEGVVPFTSFFKCKKKIAWVHCDYNKHLPIGKTEETYYSRYHTIVTVSQYTTNIIKKRYPNLADKCVSIYNLLDTAKVQNLADACIDDYRFITDKFTIISVGRIAPVKQFRLIPQIAAKLVEQGCDFRWYIIGPEFDKKESKNIIDNIATYNVSNYVQWLGGKNNPYPYFKASNLYVCTSESEACPMVFIEAKTLETPIVTSDFPAAKEFVHQGIDGFITAIEDIANPIAKIIKDEKLQATLHANVASYSYSNLDILSQIDLILK